jgi:hypothetical protein
VLILAGRARGAAAYSRPCRVAQRSYLAANLDR